MPGITAPAAISSAGRQHRLLPRPRPAERRLEAAYAPRPALGPTTADDVVDAEVLWEEVEGEASPSWTDPSPFSFARSPADLVRAYGARPVPLAGRFVDIRA